MSSISLRLSLVITMLKVKGELLEKTDARAPHDTPVRSRPARAIMGCLARTIETERHAAETLAMVDEERRHGGEISPVRHHAEVVARLARSLDNRLELPMECRLTAAETQMIDPAR